MSASTSKVVDVIVSRAKMGKNYGLVLLPEGLIEFIPEFNALIANINDVLATGVPTTEAAVRPHLQPNNQEVFDYLPDIIKAQLLLDRDPHGNVQVAKIETERLLAQMVQAELAKLAAAGEYSMKFDPQFHSYGYEGRSCLPSVFDSTYCYALGQNVAAMISLGLNGLISSVTNLHRPVSEWQCGGVPITMMCHMEKRHGHMKPVIKKALVELDGEPFKCFLAQRDAWAANDYYRGPGPIQFFPESDNVNLCITLALELLKSDPRMSLDNLTAANKLQQNAIMQGSIRHAPIQGDACELLSDLQLQRMKFIPTLCPALAGNTEVLLGPASRCQRSGDLEIMQELFPNTFGMPMANIAAGRTSGLSAKRVGVVFCGRQAPGCHDVVSGLFDSLGADSQLIGFVGGNVGLIAGNHIVLTKELVDSHRGQGGLELLCRSEDRICPSTHAAILSTCRSLELDGLVLIGGARTNTAAAHLAEYFKDAQAGTAVVTVPVDIAASLKNEFIEMTVGFDTATKVKGQITGNNATDGGSAKKYYYFMKLKGDEPSISALEVALKTKPNYVILAEEVITLNMSLSDVVRSIADVVQRRAVFGKNYGTVLIPEGLIDAIPELKNLITEINDAFTAMGSAVKHADPEAVRPHLTLWSKAVLDSLPEFMQVSLCYKRGSNNTIPMSQVETEKMLAQLVDVELKNRKAKGLYKGAFSVVCSFLGYQARGALPSNFDISYAYNLGYAATAILSAGLNGYTAAISNLKAPVADWTVSAIPIVAMLQVDESGKAKVPKAQVDLSSPAYAALAAAKDEWAVADLYENPGPAQFYGPSELTNSVPQMLMHESSEPYLASINEVQARLRRIEEACRPGCSSTVLNVALKNLTALTETVDMLEQGPRRPRASMQVDTFKANIRASF
jgi:6-phosphofructokinase 1